MLCEICVWMLRGRRGQVFGGTLGLYFIHHDSVESFWTSVSNDCAICRALGDELGASFYTTLQRSRMTGVGSFLKLRSQAHLSVVTPVSDHPVSVYRLDFTVEWADIKLSHTFVLRPTGVLLGKTPHTEYI